MFEFDPAKSAANKAKHGIDFEEAQAIWLDASAKRLRSAVPTDEERWLVIGRIGTRLWTAIMTYWNGKVRIISARRARDYEEELYGRGTQED